MNPMHTGPGTLPTLRSDILHFEMPDIRRKSRELLRMQLGPAASRDDRMVVTSVARPVGLSFADVARAQTTYARTALVGQRDQIHERTFGR